MSPVSNTRPAAVEARSTSDASLTAVFVPPTGSARGPSTSSSSPGQLSRCPTPSSTTRTPAARARSVTSSQAHSGRRDGPTATAPTPRSAITAANPPTWSAWRWLSTTSGMRRTPSRRRHDSTGTGSGPVSTNTARSRSAVARTTASPCPTSQATTAQPDTGQPGATTLSGTITTTVPITAATTSARTRRNLVTT
jgi:hypothetical protein